MREFDSIDTLTLLVFEGITYDVNFVSEDDVPDTNGVRCAVYKIVGQENVMNLGIIHIPPEESTPPQLIQTGERTIEIFDQGEGTLRIIRSDGSHEEYSASDGAKLSVDVNVGDTMQWTTGKKGARLFEICIPPWDEKKFANVKFFEP